MEYFLSVFHRGVQLRTLGYQREDPVSFLGTFIQVTKNYIVTDGASQVTLYYSHCVFCMTQEISKWNEL